MSSPEGAAPDHERMLLIISGRVQGVGYRQSTQVKALQLGLDGWVRNLKNGNVKLLAEGPPEQLDAMLLWCQNAGPRMARIQRIDVKRSPATGEFNSFEIL